MLGSKEGSGKRLGWQVSTTPILSQMWWEKQFYHLTPARELMTKARLMALGPAAL